MEGWLDTGGTGRGLEALGRVWSGWLGAWEGMHTSEPRLIDQGDRVIALYMIRARGRSSGIEVEQPVAGVFTLSAGKIVRLDLVARELGLNEAGIEE